MESLSVLLLSAVEKINAIVKGFALAFLLLGVFVGFANSQETQSSTTGSSAAFGVATAPPGVEIEAVKPTEFIKKTKHHWDKTFWSLWIPAIALNAVDVGTTQACLRHPNCREGNPIFGTRPSPWAFYSTKAASVSFGLWISRIQRRNGSNSWLMAPIAALIVGSAATINNSIVLSNLKATDSFQTRASELKSLPDHWSCPMCIKTPRLKPNTESSSKKLDFTLAPPHSNLPYELIRSDPR
jgi:hypothetical protein